MPQNLSVRGKLFVVSGFCQVSSKGFKHAVRLVEVSSPGEAEESMKEHMKELFPGGASFSALAAEVPEALLAQFGFLRLELPQKLDS